MIKSGCIAATPEGYVVKVLEPEREGKYLCQYPYHPKQFIKDETDLRFLGWPRKPIERPDVPFLTLISQRNQDAVKFFISKTQKPKREKSLKKKLADAKDDPEEFTRLLKEQGII